MKITWNQKLGVAECPYLQRWVIDFGLFTIRVHHWMASDDLRAPHDHPWWFWTLVLKGGYTDISLDRKATLHHLPHNVLSGDVDSFVEDRVRVGSLRYRSPYHLHSVKVDPGGCWTLLLTGKHSRRWGFWVKRKDGKRKFREREKYFFEHEHHPCE